MKVKELIKKLEELDQEADIRIRTAYYNDLEADECGECDEDGDPYDSYDYWYFTTDEITNISYNKNTNDVTLEGESCDSAENCRIEEEKRWESEEDDFDEDDDF